VATAATSGGILVAVQESSRADVGLGRARIDAETRSALSVNPGDILQLTGRKSTPAITFRLRKKDERKEIIRLDGLIRRNVGASIGDRIEVRKALVFPAEGVTLAPLISEGHKISFGVGIENLLKRALLNRPLMNGDAVIVPGIALMGGALPFVVLGTTPEAVVLVDLNTKVTVQEEPVLDESTTRDELSPPEVSAEFLQRLQAVLTEYWWRLDRVEGNLGRRARKLRDDVYRVLKDAKFEGDDDAPEKR